MSNTEANRFAYWTLVLTVRFALPWLTSQLRNNTKSGGGVDDDADADEITLRLPPPLPAEQLFEGSSPLGPHKLK